MTRPSAIAKSTIRAKDTLVVIFFSPRMVCCSKPSTQSRRELTRSTELRLA
jgi:hypothetical protein